MSSIPTAVMPQAQVRPTERRHFPRRLLDLLLAPTCLMLGAGALAVEHLRSRQAKRQPEPAAPMPVGLPLTTSVP